MSADRMKGVSGVPDKRFSLDSGIMTIPSDSSFPTSELNDSLSSVTSPTSAFSILSLGGIQYSYVNAILLCQWDNILGPRLEHVWYIQGRPEPHTNILRFVTSQVLSGEICRDVHSNQVSKIGFIHYLIVYSYIIYYI